MKGASRLSASYPGVTWGHSGLVSDSCLNTLKGKRLAEVACGGNAQSRSETAQGGLKGTFPKRAACRGHGTPMTVCENED